jgi:branched-chain amino acid aminotransferase
MPDYSLGSAYVDGKLLPVNEAKISILDWGLLHSDATYDVVHVWQGKFFRLEDHIDRFFAGMEKLRMTIPYNRDQLRSILIECVQASGLRDAYVEMICTRGVPQPGSRDLRTASNQFLAFAIPFVWIADPQKQREGLHLIISQQQRIPPESFDPRVKNYQWLDLVMGLFEAYERGGETAALVDAEGNLLEGPGFNIFAVKGQTISTPDRGVLEGISRRTVIELATKAGYEVKLQNISTDNALNADEVFCTSTAGGVMPVTRINDRVIGSGEPGAITQQLRQVYWALHENSEYSLEIDYE